MAHLTTFTVYLHWGIHSITLCNKERIHSCLLYCIYGIIIFVYTDIFDHILSLQIGSLRDSMTDLKTALSLQPSLSDALWHRHLLYLIQGNEQLALNDLNTLLKCNKKHFGAFRSRATLVLRQGDTSKAIFNLSQAIALQPKDAELYFMKAELHEKVRNRSVAVALSRPHPHCHFFPTYNVANLGVARGVANNPGITSCTVYMLKVMVTVPIFRHLHVVCNATAWPCCLF